MSNSYSYNFKHKKIQIRESCNNDSANLHIYTFTSNQKGPEVYIQSSLHGAELQGSLVIYQLMDYFSKNRFCGQIIFVPQCNPLSSNLKSGTYTTGRFDPITGLNYNRQFISLKELEEKNFFNLQQFVDKHIKSSKGIEYILSSFRKEFKNALNKYKKDKLKYQLSDHLNLSLTLQILSSTADIVLDLHTSQVGKLHLYLARHLLKSGKKMNFPYNIIIPESFNGAFDESNFNPSFSLYSELDRQGYTKLGSFVFKEAYTLELGNEEQIDANDSNIIKEKILNYLYLKNVVTSKNNQLILDKQYFCDLKNFIFYYSPKGGLIQYIKKPGDFVKKGQIIANLLNFSNLKDKKNLKNLNQSCIHKIKAKEDCIILNILSTANILQGMQIFQVLENVK